MPLVSQKVTPPKVYSNAWVAAKKEGGEAETWKVKARAVRSELLDYPLFMTALSMANLLSNRCQQLSMVKCLSNTCPKPPRWIKANGHQDNPVAQQFLWRCQWCIRDSIDVGDNRVGWNALDQKTALLAGREWEPIACNTSTHFMI